MSPGKGGPPYGYRSAVRAFSFTIVAFGFVILGLTLARGGGVTSVGFLFGLLFIGLGLGRLWVSGRG